MIDSVPRHNQGRYGIQITGLESRGLGSKPIRAWAAAHKMHGKCDYSDAILV